MELALAGTPTALLYRAHWLTELLMRKSLRIGCASLPNLVAFDHATGPYPPGDDVLQPERLFRDATEDAAAEALGYARRRLWTAADPVPHLPSPVLAWWGAEWS